MNFVTQLYPSSHGWRWNSLIRLLDAERKIRDDSPVSPELSDALRENLSRFRSMQRLGSETVPLKTGSI